MKKNIMIVLFCSFVMIIGMLCGSKSEVIIAEGEMQNDYTMKLIMTHSNKLKNQYSGIAELVIENAEGKVTDKQNINELFGKKIITLPNGVLKIQDYNNDSFFDVAIGIQDDETDEFQYKILSVDGEGQIILLNSSGYKVSGFIYSVGNENYPQFVQVNDEVKNESAIMIGVRKSQTIIPAEYYWNGKQFIFREENPKIVSRNNVPEISGYEVWIEQTRFMQPLNNYDEDFSIYESFILGDFDIILIKDKEEIDRVNLNALFASSTIGWIDYFDIIFDDYNNDGQYEFAIGQAEKDSPEFKYVLICIDKDRLYKIEANGYKEDGYIYNAEDTPRFRKKGSGIIVTINQNGWEKHEYVWDSGKKLFSFK